MATILLRWMTVTSGLLTCVERFNFDDILNRAMGDLVGPSRTFIARDTDRDGVLGDNRHFGMPNVSNSTV